MSSKSNAAHSRRTSGVQAGGRRAKQVIGAATAPISRIDEHAIRERAYYIYLERNGGPGDALGDWFRAEYELAEPGPARE
jgi:hypothetical protein